MSRRRSTIEAVLEANAYRLGNATVFAGRPDENSTARVLSAALVNVAREVDAALGNDHEEPLRGVRVGRRYRWVGPPGDPVEHYQPIDVETMAAGYVIGYAKGIARAALSGPQARTLAEAGGGDVPSIGQFGGALQRKDAAELPIDSENISMAIGVQPDQFERHSALGDVLWARAIWDRIHEIGDPA